MFVRLTFANTNPVKVGYLNAQRIVSIVQERDEATIRTSDGEVYYTTESADTVAGLARAALSM